MEVPESIARQVRTCAAYHLAHLGSGDKSIRFEVKLASDGQVDSVALGESTLGDQEAEACMAGALRALSADDLPMRRSASLSSELVAPESRALVGNPALLALAPVSLAPVIITGIGIIVIVAVIVYVATSTDNDDDERARCKKVKQECIQYCSDTVLPTQDYGVSFQNCKSACLERHGCPQNS